MALFTERNNIRKEIEKTYNISPPAYELLFRTCSKYFVNLAWLFPNYCPDDGLSIFSYNKHDFIEEMKFEIPNLVDGDDFIKPVIVEDIFTNEKTPNYDQYAILDFIEYIFKNIKDYNEIHFHSFFNHFHLYFNETSETSKTFLYDINRMFKRTGLLYELKDNGQVERAVLNGELIIELKSAVENIKDKGLKELIEEALSLYLKPDLRNIGTAVEKLWDAFERAKTYYAGLDKKTSSTKLIETIAENQIEMFNVIEKEFKELTDLGNQFRIRHHETDRIDFVSDNHREYFFNRCLSLMAVVLKYIE